MSIEFVWGGEGWYRCTAWTSLGGEIESVETTSVASRSVSEVKGGGMSSSHSDSVTTSQTTQYVVSPGRQVVQVAGIVYKNQTGNIQVNYGDRVFGHYIVSLRLARCRFLSSVIRAEAAVVVYWYTSHRVDSNG